MIGCRWRLAQVERLQNEIVRYSRIQYCVTIPQSAGRSVLKNTGVMKLTLVAAWRVAFGFGPVER
jgi:hypothetical protein